MGRKSCSLIYHRREYTQHSEFILNSIENVICCWMSIEELLKIHSCVLMCVVLGEEQRGEEKKVNFNDNLCWFEAFIVKLKIHEK